MKYIFPILFLAIFLTGCNQESKQKLSYNEQENRELENPQPVRPKISDLPVQIDSTAYILHPIGEFGVDESYSRWSEFGSSGSGSGGPTHNGYFSADNYYGNLSNVKFQHITSDSLSALTDRDIKISGFSFLRELFEKTGSQFLLYQVNDKDSNNDNYIDQHDIKTLYISSINGKEFRKILPDNQELMDWRFISNLNRLYFRSIEDTNRNGKFEQEDLLHYFYIDFDTEALQVVEHFPV